MDKKILQELLAKQNVTSVGRGLKKVGGVSTGRQCIVIGVTKKLPIVDLAAKDIIPKIVGSHAEETDVVEVGEIRLLGVKPAPPYSEKMIDRKSRLRPSPGGMSVGHFQITAGTLGCWVKKNGQWMMLSNCHVLANLGDCKIGDPILQPGAYDGGTVENDEIAKLYEFVPISMIKVSSCPFANAITSVVNFFAHLFGRKTRLKAFVPGEPNTVDCAIAAPNHEEDILDKILEDDGSFIKIEGEAEPEIGMKCKKSGRTTGTTHGEISQVEVAVTVNMGNNRTALFVDQIIIEKEGMSAGGDSGSAVLTEEGNKIVGLLFAGSEKTMVANSFSNVKEALKLD